MLDRGNRRVRARAAICGMLLAVVVPAIGSGGPAQAAGCPGVRAAAFANVVVQRDQTIAMSDGVVLHYNAVLPSVDGAAPAAGPFPVLLTQTPYNKNATGLNFQADDLVRHGYAQVVVDVRGTGASEGSWDSFGPAEQRDSAELVDWLTGAGANPRPSWARGDVGLHGTSYGAINQLLTAAQRPVVKSLFPIVPMADAYRDITGSGGQVNTSFIPSWLGLVTGLGLLPPTDTATNPAGSAAVLASHAQNVTQFQGAAVANATTGGTNAFDGPFYRVRSPIEVIDQVTSPTFIAGGWYDLFQRGEPLLFQRLQANGVPTKLIMGPWTHIGIGSNNGLPTINEPCSLADLELRWHDHYLRGDNNDLSDIADVTYKPINATDFARSTTWPPTGPEFTKLYASGTGSGVPGRLAASAPTGEESPSLLLQQMPSGACSKSTTQWTAGGGEGGFCDTDNEVNDPTGAVFDLPITAATELAGPIAAHLYVSTTASDAFLTARLEDVEPAGRSHQLSAGWNVLSMRALDDSKSEIAGGDYVRPYHPFTSDSALPVAAGTVYEVWVELFPVAAALPAGHTLRLAVQTSDAPHLSAPIPQMQRLAGGVVSVYHDALRPSSVVVPFMP